MLIIILFNFQGERTHFKGERTQGERTQGDCAIRANWPDTLIQDEIKHWCGRRHTEHLRILLSIILWLSP